MELESSSDPLPLCFLKASWIRDRSEDNATVLLIVFQRLETLCARGGKVTTTVCLGKVGEDRQRQADPRTDHFSGALEANANESSLQTITADLCTQSSAPHVHPLASAPRRMNSAESAAASLFYGIPLNPLYLLSLINMLIVSHSTRRRGKQTYQHASFLWHRCFLEIVSTEMQQTSIFAPPD